MIGSQRRLKSEGSETSKKIPFTSNEVIQGIEKKGEVVFYLPCYLRFLVKEIENVDAGGMSATLSGTLIFTFYYGNIDRQVIDQFVNPDKSKAILLEFNQAESILLKQDKGITMKQDENERLITFTVRQRFDVDVKGSVFLTPFQTLDMYLAVTIQSVRLVFPGEGKPNVCFKFNCMTTTEVDVLGHGEEISFGYYRIAIYYMDTKYQNTRKNPFQPISFSANKNKLEDQDDDEGSQKRLSNPEGEEQNQIRNYQYAHFRIPIYKYPGVSILTIFVPIWILGLIGLFVFFQEPGFGARLATIAVLALAYVAFIPTINQSIPKTPEIKLVDLLILMQLGSTILLLGQSFRTKQVDSSGFNFAWSDSILFLIALGLNAATFAIVIGLLIVHKCYWERKYQKMKITMNKKYHKFTKKMWSNKECDLYFSKFSHSNKIVNL